MAILFSLDDVNTQAVEKLNGQFSPTALEPHDHSGVEGFGKKIDGVNITGTVANATNITGGGIGRIPYNTASDTTGFISAGTSAQVLIGGNAPTWVDISSLNVASAATATLATTATLAEAAKGDTRFQVSGRIGGSSPISIASYTALSVQKICRIIPNGKGLMIKRASYNIANTWLHLNITTTPAGTTWSPNDNFNDISSNTYFYNNSSGSPVTCSINISIYNGGVAAWSVNPYDSWWLDLSIE
jgi:hypothetical protein